jgi:phage terminase large subunit GpA-like protein
VIEFWPKEKQTLKPPERISVSEWSNKNIILLPESSREPGPYRWQRTSYVRDLLDLYKHPSVHHLVLKFATQTGKTQTLYNILAYIIDQEPFSTLMLYATEDQAR